MAEQKEPVRRRVALKLIKLGMDTRAVIGRFEAERQALALMDHPNIAKVFDAGAAETGRPYFVMELVQGVRITDYCDQHCLSTHARLGLFMQVCHAIQHAHQKGIIHRDLKPSNILVTLQDGLPLPKVIDFGIAKATGGQVLTDKTLYTAMDQFLGTPAYTSPEQAQAGGVDIDTRSDIYNLGVLLYELLTGHTPFEQKELVAAGLDEMRRIIREQEPARPSTRLSTLAGDEKTTVARRRHSDPPQLLHLLRGDLDWIVMKCLEKDRTRRYETAGGLADDVTHHLNNEPVVARPPSRVYRFHKLVRRNKVVFAAAGAVTAALVIGLGLATWLLVREQAAHRQAVTAQRQAQAQAKKSEQVALFLEDMLQGVGPSVAMGQDTTLLREILDKTAERVGQDLKDQPETEAELRSTLGDVYFALSRYTDAAAMHRAALAIRTNLWGKLNTNVADSLEALARALYSQDWASPEVEPLLLESLNIRTNLLGTNHAKVASSLFNLGYVRIWPTRNPEAEPFIRQSLAIRRKLLGNDSLETAQALSALAEALWCQSLLSEAESAAREALAIQSRVSGAEPLWDAESTHVILGIILLNQQRFDEAETVLRQALKGDRTVVGTNHLAMVQALNCLGCVLFEKGELAEAETLAREAVAASKRLFGSRYYTPFCLFYLGWTLHKGAKLGEAESALREALAVFEQQPFIFIEEAWTRSELTTVLRAEGKPTEIESLFRQSVATQRKITTTVAREREARLLAGLGEFLLGQGKPAEAEGCCREVVTNAAKLWPDNPERWPVSTLVQALLHQGKTAEAEQVLQDLLPAGAHNSPVRARFLETEGFVWGRQGRWKEAIEAYTTAIELEPTNPGSYHKLAPLLVFSGDLAGYRQLVQTMLARFGRTDRWDIGDAVGISCLLLPCSGADLAAAAALAESGPDAGYSSGFRFQFRKGLAEYRRAHFTAAVEWMRKALAETGNSCEVEVSAQMVLAMARHELQQTNEARAALAEGLQLGQTRLPQLASRDLGTAWADWLIAQILLREAKALIEGESTTNNTEPANLPIEFNKR